MTDLAKYPKVLVIVPHYWGKGDTITEAWKQVRAAGYSGRKWSGKYRIYAVEDTDEVKVRVTDLGGISRHRDSMVPVLLDEGGA